MRAFVNADACIGCALCSNNCSAVFELNDDGVAMVIADPVPVDAAEACREAAKDCPVNAITVEA